MVRVGSVIYLMHTRRTRTGTIQSAHQPALETDSTVM
jgi:hypothetical protein